MSAPVYKWQPTTRVIAEKAGISESDVIRFDQNTIGQAPSWVTGFLQGLVVAPNEYPQSDYFRLRSAIAEYRQCPVYNVLVGAGADDMIAVCAATFLEEGSVALAAGPTYSLYRVATSQRRAKYRSINRDAPAWRLPVDALIEAAPEASMIWLCEPNNPTGTRDTDDELATVLSAVSVPVVIDAAYAEFTNDSWWPWIQRFPNLIVLGTFSKENHVKAAENMVRSVGQIAPELSGGAKVHTTSKGSMVVQPVNRMTAPEISAATEPSKSPITWSRAARTFRSCRSPDSSTTTALNS